MSKFNCIEIPDSDNFIMETSDMNTIISKKYYHLKKMEYVLNILLDV